MINSHVQSNIYKSMSEFAFAGLATSFKIGCQIASTNLSMASKILETTRHLQEATHQIHTQTQTNLAESAKSAAEPAKKTKSSKNGINGKSAPDADHKASPVPTPFWFFPLEASSRDSDRQSSDKKSESFAFTPFPVSPFLKMFQAPQGKDLSSKSPFTPFLEAAQSFWTPKQLTPFFAGSLFPAFPNFASFNQPGFNFDPFKMLNNNPFKAFFPFQDSPKPAHLFQPHHVLPWAVTMPVGGSSFSPVFGSPFSFPFATPSFTTPFSGLSQGNAFPLWSMSQPDALRGFMTFFTGQR